MVGTNSISPPQTFVYTPANPSLTGFASNVSGASWPLTATSSGDGLAHQVSIRNDTANDKAAINITLVGTDADGNAQTETIAGPGASATVESTLYYKTLTSVTPASTWGADTADIGWVDEFVSPVLPLDWLNLAIAALNVNVGGTINFSLEQTFYQFTRRDLYPEPSQDVQWVTIASSQTADGIWRTTGGALGLRFVVNSYSNGATVVLNVNPTVVSNQPDGGSGTTEDINVAEWGGITTTLGQKAMTASVPVVIASDQSPVAVQNETATAVTPAAVTLVAATSNTLLAANANRIRAVIINPLASPLFVRLAASAATAAAGGYDYVVPPVSGGVPGQLVLAPGEYSGQIRGICASAGDVGVSEQV